MNFISYCKHNWLHYTRKMGSAIGALSITFCSKSDYTRMTVPSWNATRLISLRASSSLISRLIALNSDAVLDADQIIEGNYRILSHRVRTDGRFPNWHQDYLSGHQYILKPYLHYDIPEDTGADIIVPWEFSRFLFVPTLISAYLITNDLKYADHFFQLLENWEEENPYLHGINWMCGLDIAIRAFNIALGLIYFSVNLVQERHEKATRLLWAHLRYLQERDLYQSKITINNHQLVAAVLHFGLLHLFDGRTVDEWRQGAYKIVSSELAIQFHDDGGNYESAFLYHQFVLESLYAARSLITKDQAVSSLNDGGILPASFEEILLKATDFTASYARVWKATPQVGDSSDGRIIFHTGYFSWSPDDYSYLEDWSTLVFQERSPFSVTAKVPEARIFENSGLGFFLTERYGALFCAMPVIQRAAGHNHMDKTSVVLRIGETPVLVDTGTFCYTSDTMSRMEHRSGKGHNVLLVNQVDQAALDGSGTFSAPAFGELGLTLDSSNCEAPKFLLWHDGYRRISGVGRVERHVNCLSDGLQIHDRVDGKGSAFLELVFNLHPDLSTQIDENRARVNSDNENICTITFEKGWNLSIQHGFYSASYGSRQPNTRLVVSTRRDLPVEVLTEITIH